MNTIRELESGAWARQNPKDCPCLGWGWYRTDYDVSYRCPLHGKGAGEGNPRVTRAHLLKMQREAYVAFREAAEAVGFRGDFKAVCALAVGPNPTPQEWVDAAEQIAQGWENLTEEREANAKGFSCALEARWAEPDEDYDGRSW